MYRPDGIDTTYVSDTLIEEMVRRNSAILWQDLSWLDLYAGQFYSSNEQGYSGVRQIKTNSFNGRGQKYIRRSEIDGDSCLNYTIICPNWPEDYFVEGCGGPFYVYPGFGLESRRELRYFKKGGEQWGFPLADDCNDLISSADVHASLDDGLLVYPNPFTRQLFVSSKTAMISVLRIFDVSGNLQIIEKVDGYHALLNTSLLPAGLYLVEIQGSDGQIFRQKIIRK
ncbi:MAG: T9SS type A sorting domain-containing protein [Bacteroidales bacterium]|nr:T9SS type A sorting domain-containing protein [Bacteroidales bacterium]